MGYAGNRAERTLVYKSGLSAIQMARRLGFRDQLAVHVVNRIAAVHNRALNIAPILNPMVGSRAVHLDKEIRAVLT
jgi:hypothetical protein